jgi:hypothetical protein
MLTEMLKNVRILLRRYRRDNERATAFLANNPVRAAVNPSPQLAALIAVQQDLYRRSQVEEAAWEGRIVELREIERALVQLQRAGETHPSVDIAVRLNAFLDELDREYGK